MSVRFRVIFATACAVLAMIVCLNYSQHVQAEADRARSEVLARYGGEVVTLVVSSAALEPGDVASQSNVTTREWLVDLAPEGALTSLDDVLGKEVGNAAPKGFKKIVVLINSGNAFECAKLDADDLPRRLFHGRGAGRARRGHRARD